MENLFKMLVLLSLKTFAVSTEALWVITIKPFLTADVCIKRFDSAYHLNSTVFALWKRVNTLHEGVITL